MTQVTLPTELLRPIIASGLLDKGDLCSVAQASRSLRDEGQRILFRDPGTISVRAGHRPSGARAFFNAILGSPHRLALMVQTYTQSTRWTNYTVMGQDATLHSVQDELFEMMADSLKLMVNLRSLHLSGSAVQNDYSPTSMVHCLQQCTFTLQEFTWNHRGEERPLLENFLTTQVEIRSLNLPHGFDIRGSWDVSDVAVQRLLLAGKQACPKLESLHGPMSASRVLLPGKRNMKFINWIWALFMTEALEDTDLHLSHIYEALETVQYLEYGSSDAAGFQFKTVVPYLNSLVALTISNSRMKEVSELIRGLPSLRAIDFFHEGFWNIFSADVFAEDYTYISSIFILCIELQFVDVTRHLDVSSVIAREQEGEPITRRFVMSRETGEVTAKKIDKAQERWWKDREQVVFELSRGTHI